MEPKKARRNYYFGMERVRKFIPGARISAGLLVLTSAAIACIYGSAPLVSVSDSVFHFVLLVWFWNFCIFALCGGMVLSGWLIDCYGDPPKEGEPSK
jgi:hypothetical protein